MANLTYYASNKINNNLLGRTSLTTPATYYLGVSGTLISQDGTGKTEPIDSVYNRIAIANNKTNFSVSSNGLVTNLVAFEFAETTINWGNINYWFLADAATNGNIWLTGALAVGIVVGSGATLTLPISAFDSIMQ